MQCFCRKSFTFSIHKHNSFLLSKVGKNCIAVNALSQVLEIEKCCHYVVLWPWLMMHSNQHCWRMMSYFPREPFLHMEKKCLESLIVLVIYSLTTCDIKRQQKKNAIKSFSNHVSLVSVYWVHFIYILIIHLQLGLSQNFFFFF